MSLLPSIDCGRFIAFISLWLSSWLVVACTLTSQVWAQSLPAPLIFPPAAVIDVTRPPYNAKGDGVTDDTAALQKAINEQIGKQFSLATLYLPMGTYLVSDRLVWKDSGGRWNAYLTLQGAGRDRTIIKLKDRSPGYNDPSVPKAVIFTASLLKLGANPSAGGKNWIERGEGNEAFQNNIFDLTVDTASNNPGAIGIDYLTNNQGIIKNVTIRSADGNGVAGLSLTRKWPGPLLLQNITAIGFNYGVDIAQNQYSVTLAHVALERQKIAGIRNYENQVYIEDLRSKNGVPAIVDSSVSGLVVVIGGTFTGGSASFSAVESRASIYLRNVSAAGYKSAVQYKDTVVEGLSQSEYISKPVLNVFPSPQSSLNLSITQAPDFHDYDLSQWANVVEYGAIANDSIDDSTAIQTAIDSGKSTVYFPPGLYRIKNTVQVRGGVKKVIGMFATVAPDKNYTGNGPAFRFENINGEFVVFERFVFTKNWWEPPNPIFTYTFENASSKTVVIRHMLGNQYRNTSGFGSVFLEDVCCGNVEINRQNMWARQLNIESVSSESMLVNSMLVNNGGNVWILGYKTERANTVLKTISGGYSELLGGSFYPVSFIPFNLPLVVNDGSQHSLIYIERSPILSQFFTVQVRETRNGKTKLLLFNDTYRYFGGTVRMVPLFVGKQLSVPEKMPAPGRFRILR